MEESIYVSPAALSFIFRVHNNPDLKKMGSTGVGCTLGMTVGVRVKKQTNKTEVFFNDKPIELSTVSEVVKSITTQNFRVIIESVLPLGFGFGISGASSLATACALDAYLGKKMSYQQLIYIAHAAEIKHKTGLGTVSTIAIGGFLIKTSPGISPTFRRLPFEEKRLYATIISPLRTSHILKNDAQVNKINREAATAMGKIMQMNTPLLEDIIDISYVFAKNSDLLHNPKVIRIIEALRASGEHATMTMLGNVVISTTNVDDPNFQTVELDITNNTIQSQKNIHI